MDPEQYIYDALRLGHDVETICIGLQSKGLTLFKANMLIGMMCVMNEFTPEETHSPMTT